MPGFFGLYHPASRPGRHSLCVEALRERAEADGQGTLAYLLDIAKLEAERISTRARLDEEEWKADPNDFWRPV